MPKHNSGRNGGDGQQRRPKKKPPQGGRRQHVNKYAQHSRAEAEQQAILRQGEDSLNTQVCKRCNRPVANRDWVDHRCGLVWGGW